MEGNFFYQAFIYLSAAVIAVPIAKKLGLGSVLGYLIAGVLIGPFVLEFVGEEGQDVMHFAEFGVVMMLFLVGLELKPSLLWKLRVPILGLGGIQVIITTGIITTITLSVSTLIWQEALAIGLTLALSSTAIVLQTLNEKGLLKTIGGQNAFSVLLFQDIAVIPILAFLPLLATSKGANTGHETQTLIDGLPVAIQTLIVFGVIASIILIGRYFISYIFRLIAQTRLRELFTAASLFLVIGITLLMTVVGLSPALGTFLAGVVLAQSEYRHELETDIEPFKGLLLGLFFIAVGASIDFNLIIENPGLIASIAAGLIVVKLIILAVVGRLFGMRTDNNLLFTFGLAQGGEFAFVLFSYAVQNGVLSSNITNPMIAAVAISMALTPLLMLLNEKLIIPNVGTKESDDRKVDTIDEKNEVIIAGFGRYGSTIGRFLQANGTQATYLDMDPNNVDLLRKLGLKVFYGDASRHDLLNAAGAADAKLLIVAVDYPEKTTDIVETAQKYFPHLKIIVRSKTWDNYYQLLDKNLLGVYREFSDVALRMGADALGHIGYRKNQVQRSLKKFRKHDEAYLKELVKSRHERNTYIKHRRRVIEELELMMLEDIENEAKDKDLGWDTETIKEEFAPLIRKLRDENM
ncbi:MAG: monovalent cation:proton antiporter-2 (CPA2) family protein [Bacteroidales bacterium]|jgi:monovalent cation:proton antiporter-2 (CPA2) family protein|nr:monovalent cation:proton antiporter-2 (CPA2) family protein [Bacteroidales bacterium]